MSLYSTIDDALKEVFDDYIQCFVDYYKFTENQEPADDLYEESIGSEKEYEDAVNMQAFYVRRVTDAEIQAYGNVISDATAKLIFRAETLKENTLWNETTDRTTIKLADKFSFEGTEYRCVNIREIGKVENQYVALIVFMKEDVSDGT